MVIEMFPPEISGKREGEFFSGTPQFINDGKMTDSFKIDVSSVKCTVTGGKNGLIYAKDLLNDLKNIHGAIPCAVYSDSPDTAFRCYHLDLKKGSGGVEDIKRTFRRLRSLRFNSVLVEYENRIALNSLPGIAAEDAFTREEIRELNTCAAENGLEIIPLLQSFGHLEYLLRHPDYRKYAEDEGGTQFCPCNEDAFELWKKVFDEIHELHPESKTFHIGGDETRHLGECPSCSSFAAGHSVEELFFRHIDRVCRHAVSRRCRPMLWHDMLTKAGRSDLLAKLPEETVVIYWDYKAKSELVNNINIKEGSLVSRKWLNMVRSAKDFCDAPHMFTGFIEDASEKVTAYAEKVRDGNDFTRFIPFANLKMMREAGINVYGASSLGYSPYASLLGDTERSFTNMETWINSGVNGVIVTRWASNDTLDPARGPASLRDFQLALSAEIMWNNSITREEAEKRYDRCFGADDISLAGILNMIVYSENEMFINWAEHCVNLIGKLENNVPDDLKWIYQKHCTAAKAELIIRRIRSFMRNRTGIMSGHPAAAVLEEKIKEIKDELRRDFSDEYPQKSLEEWILRLFQPYDAMFAGLRIMKDRSADDPQDQE